MALRALGKIRPLPLDLGALRCLALRNYPTQVEVEAESETFRNPTARKVKRVGPIAQYGGRHAVTVLPGGGIGPELIGYVREIFKFAGVPIDFEEINIDPASESNEELELAITSIRRNGVALKGNIETNTMATGVISRNVALRNELDLYVSVINCKSIRNIPSRHKDIDILIVRQNTEGEYAMLEHENVPGVVESMKVVTAKNAERVARFAFEYAKKNNRKKVTTIHKANIMKISDGLFLNTSKRIAKEYPEIQHNHMIIDNCCMQLVSNPQQFDVMNMTNLYGTIVSNVICGLIGSAGLLSGRNYGDHYAIFEPGTRNTGTAIAGKNIANPIAMINAAVDMIEHLGHNKHAYRLRRAINRTLVKDQVHTPDLGGKNTSTEVVERILINLDNSLYRENQCLTDRRLRLLKKRLHYSLLRIEEVAAKRADDPICPFCGDRFQDFLATST